MDARNGDTMTPEDRLHQLTLLAIVNGWSRADLQRECEERYPHGPTPDGTGWPSILLDSMYALVQEAHDDDALIGVLLLILGTSLAFTAAGNNYANQTGTANFPLGASTSMGPMQDTYDTMLVRTASAFLGMGNYDCVLCHNGRGHLDQVNLWGSHQTRLAAQSMAAHFSRLTFTPAAPSNSFMVSDSASGTYDLNTDSGNRPPRTPAGSSASLYPMYREAAQAPEGNDWRAAFADQMTADPMFARNLANRLWKAMFGLPLADPVDGLDPERLDPAQPPAERGLEDHRTACTCRAARTCTTDGSVEGERAGQSWDARRVQQPFSRHGEMRQSSFHDDGPATRTPQLNATIRGVKSPSFASACPRCPRGGIPILRSLSPCECRTRPVGSGRGPSWGCRSVAATPHREP
jgi:hypothetical protein